MRDLLTAKARVKASEAEEVAADASSFLLCAFASSRD
jgi:hypothetical protein